MTARLTGWATAADVTAAVRRKWERGDLLRDLHAARQDWSAFPLRVRLPGPDRAELPTRFADASAWAQALKDAAARNGWQLLTRPVRAPGLGTQPLPVAAIVASPDDGLRLLGPEQRSAAARFADALAEADKIGPAARALTLTRPHDVLAAGGDWPLLLALAAWIRDHPRPGIFPRQVPVAGVHTKVVERHTTLLGRLLEAVLDPGAVDRTRRTFAARFGFTDPARRVRVRGSSAALGVPGSEAAADVEWDVAALAGLDPHQAGIVEVLVLENKTSYLTAPAAPGRLLLWGAGYGADELLGALPWRRAVDIRYWGDIDTHGFAILARVRGVAAHTVSVLMDEATLVAHQPFWSTERTPCREPLVALTGAEAELYAALRADVYGPAVRLEQEFIRYDLVAAALLG